MLRRLRNVDFHLLLLLAITVLVNVPFLSPRFVVVCDSLNGFIHFHFAYSQILFHNEFPRWNPFALYGITFDLALFACLQPTDYFVIGVGWLFRIKDVHLLAVISYILSDCLFVLGLYLLGRKLFRSTGAVWLVCLGGILTNDWTFSVLWCFNIFYLLPLVFYFLLRFMEEGRAVHLWLAGIIELLSLLGTITYIPPIHLMILGTFLVPFVWRDPRLLLRFVHWRNFVHPLFFVFVVFALLIAGLVLGIDADLMRYGRDGAGNTPIDDFVEWGRQPLSTLARSLLRGDMSRIEITLFVGYLPLALAGYALLRRRDTPLIAFTAAAVVIFWFALGGWFTTFVYYAVPLMKKFRLISHSISIARPLILLVAGFGFDQLVSDLKGTACVARNGQRRGWWGEMALAFIAFVLVQDFRCNNRAEDPLGWREHGRQFASELVGSGGLMPRLVLYTCIFAVLLTALRWRRASPRLVAAMPMLLLAVYLIDAGWFYLQIVKNAPFCHAGTAATKVFDARRIEYSARRHMAPRINVWVPQLSASELAVFCRQLSADAGSELPGDVLMAVSCPRSGFDHRSHGVGLYLLMNYDVVAPEFGLDMAMPGVKPMLEAHGAIVRNGGLRGESACEFPDGGKDSPLLESLGYSSDKSAKVNKIRIVRQARFVKDMNEAIDVFKQTNPRDMLVIVDPTRAGTVDDARNASNDGEPDVQLFTANRQVVRIKAGAPGWLFIADAYHRGWQARVDGQPTKVFRANVGCRAVHLDEGEHTIEFHFDDGGRDLIRRGFFVFAFVLSWILVAGLFASPWLVGEPSTVRCRMLCNTHHPAPYGARLAGDDRGLVRRTWAVLATLTFLACLVSLTVDFGVWTLLILSVAAAGVLAVAYAGKD